MSYVWGTSANAANNASGNSLTLSATYAVHDRVQVWQTYGSGARIVESCSDGTNTYAYVTTLSDATNGQSWALFECLDAAAGTFTITFGLASAAGARGVAAFHESGLANTGSLQNIQQVQAAPGTGTDALTSTNLTPASQPGMLLGLAMDDSTAGTITAGTGFTNEGAQTNWDSAFSTTSRAEDKRLTATTAVAATFTVGTGADRYAAWAIFIPEASGAAAPTVGQAFKAQGPGNTPMSGGGGERFRPFVQGIPAAAVIPQGWPGIAKDQQTHPGSGPGNRPFPNFVQGIPAAAVIPQGNPGTVQITAMHPGAGPGARQFPNFRQGIAPPASSALSIDATAGTWTWAGTTATTSQLINSDGGASAWTWAGTTATTSQLIGATPGTWSWAGLTATTSQLVNASPGTWSWAGTTAGTTQFISATPAAYTWAGVDAATTQLVNSGVGAFTWAGTTATFGGALDATPGSWSWSGTTAEIPTQIGATVGGWSWLGTTATIPSGAVGGGGKHHRRYQIKLGKQVFEGSKEAVEQIVRDIAIREAREAEQTAPVVAEILVQRKKRKPAITAATPAAAEVQAAYRKALADEVARLQEQDDEEALIALLT